MFLMMFCLFVSNVNAQIAVTVTNNTNTTPNLAASYTSLATALTDLNAVTTMTGPVTLVLAAGNETTPSTGLQLGSASLNAVLNATNTVTIIGAGSTTILNAGVGTATPASAVPDGILKLVGVDYVTIDGITFTDGNTTNPATMEVGLGMFKLSATDGCQNNTIQNCIFNMQRVNNATGTTPMVDGSVGIVLMNSTALASTTVLTVTAASGASSNNRFYSNTINGGNYGIVLRGFAASSPFTLADTNNDVGGIALATGNTILNYGGAAAATNPSAAIRIVDQWAANVSFNTINNNNGSGVNHVSTLRGIITSGGTSASLNINNNGITLFGGGTTSQLDGISNGAGSTAAGNSININNNTLVLNYASATGATINGIVNSSSAATVNINGNNISAGSIIPGTGTHILISGGSPVNLNISGNTINNFSRSSATTGTLRGIVITSPTTTVINNNTISNLSYTNAASTGIIEGIYCLSSSIDVTISNNSVNGLTAAGGIITGIREFGVAGNKNIFGNTIYNFSNTAGYAGTGVNYFGIHCSTGVINIYRNKVYGLTSLGTTGANAAGIFVTGGTTSNISNNIIGQLYTPTATGLNAVRGIDISGGTTINIYNNTVRLDATSTSVTTFGSSCLQFNTTPTTVDVRNNIFANASTPAQEGANVATNGISAGIRRTTGTAAVVPANYATSSNKNLFWVNPSAGTNNHTAYAEGTGTVTNLQNTVAALKTFMVNRDQQSVEENPTFVSTTGSNVNFLHINTVTPTAVESGASVIGSVTNDFDGDIRQGAGGYVGTGSAPDIGADEFEGISSTPACTGTPAATNTLSSVASTCSGVNFNLSLSTAYTELNYTYQWQSSPDGIAPYTNIVGQTAATASVNQTAATFYQCVITCTNGGATATSTPFQVTMNSVFTCYCASTYTSGPGTTDGMTNVTLLTLNNTTTQNNVAPYYTFYNAVTIPDLPQNSNQSISITFGSDSNQFGGVWIDWNQDGDLNDVGEFVANNIVTTGANGTIVLTIAVPAGATLGNTLMRVRGGNDTALTNTPCGASSSIYGETEDYIVNIVTNPICSGAPVASNTTAPTSVCSGTNFNLGLSVVQTGTGYTYQWQSSPDGIAPYTNIVGQTAATATLSQTAATFYQCVITCTGSGLTNISTPAQVGLNLQVNCFCPAAVSNTADTEIGNVTYGSLNNGTATPVLSNPTAINAYTSFTSLPATNIVQGETNSFSLRQITSGGTFYAAYANVFIDYNGNGVFDLPAERALSAGPTVVTPLNNLLTGNITIPVTSVTGNVLMRVVLLEGGSNTTPACSPLGAGTTYGEVEDYVLNITPCVAPAITTQPVASASVCENAAVNLSVVATGTGLTYQWKKDTVDIPSATSATYSIPSALVADSGSYTVLVTGACGTILSDPSVVTVTANSSLPTEVVSVCDTYTWAANGTTYTTSGTYTNVVNCVTRTLDLTITPSSSLPTEVVSVCDTYTWAANGTVYTTSGIYTSTTSCVTRTLDLTITPSSSLPTEVVSVCNTTYTWSANGTVYSTGGIYTSTTACVTRTLDLTILTATTPTGTATQTLNGGVAADVTIEDIVVSGTGIIWYPTLADANAGTNPIAAGTVLTDNTSYFAVSVNGTCRSAALEVLVTVVLGNASFDLSQLTHYPNPVKDIFNVKYNKEIISIEVYDLTGRNVISVKPNTLEVQLNMTNLSSAMYIVRLQSVDGITELKVIKN